MPAKTKKPETTKKTTKKAPAKKGNGQTILKLPKTEFEVVALEIIGTRPLIMHAWDPKTMRIMIAKQMGHPEAAAAKEDRDPDREYRMAMYRIPQEAECGSEYGIPAAGFKQSFVDACRQTSLMMTQVQQSFQVRGIEVEMPPLALTNSDGSKIPLGARSMELIPIFGSEPEMRADMVRLDKGGADMRFRPQFRQWRCLVPVQILKGSMTPATLTALANTAGFACGVCEWRPFSKKSKNGSYGMYKVADGAQEHRLFKGLKVPEFAL